MLDITGQQRNNILVHVFVWIFLIWFAVLILLWVKGTKYLPKFLDIYQ